MTESDALNLMQLAMTISKTTGTIYGTTRFAYRAMPLCWWPDEGSTRRCRFERRVVLLHFFPLFFLLLGRFCSGFLPPFAAVPLEMLFLGASAAFLGVFAFLGEVTCDASGRRPRHTREPRR
jgi:hypothetical protein